MKQGHRRINGFEIAQPGVDTLEREAVDGKLIYRTRLNTVYSIDKAGRVERVMR